jgi:hypothetical protein
MRPRVAARNWGSSLPVFGCRSRSMPTSPREGRPYRHYYFVLPVSSVEAREGQELAWFDVRSALALPDIAPVTAFALQELYELGELDEQASSQRRMQSLPPPLRFSDRLGGARRRSEFDGFFVEFQIPSGVRVTGRQHVGGREGVSEFSEQPVPAFGADREPSRDRSGFPARGAETPRSSSNRSA